MKFPKLALAMALALGGTAVIFTGPADAQRDKAKQKAETGPTLTREESAAINPVLIASRATPPDWAAAAAALPAAQAGAQSPYARYVVGQLQLAIGRGTNNTAMQTQAVDAMIASGGAPAASMAILLGGRATLALQASDWAAAETALTRVVELAPNDINRLYQLAEVKIRLNKNNEAFALYQRLLQLDEAAGRTSAQEHIRQALGLAVDQRATNLIAPLSQRLVRAYPTTENWRSALVTFRSGLGDADAQLALDVRRLMKVAQAFQRQGDYLEFVSRLDRTAQWGEARAVLDQGIARGALNRTDAEVMRIGNSLNARITEDRSALPALRTRALAAATGREARIAGDTFYGYGQYPQAIELYRAASQKGGEDANLLNTRLGASLAAAGQTAEAQAAFRAVTGPRAALATYWLLWLERPATAAAPPAPTPPAQPTGN